MYIKYYFENYSWAVLIIKKKICNFCASVCTHVSAIFRNDYIDFNELDTIATNTMEWDNVILTIIL